MNNITVLGRLTADPTEVQTKTGSKMAYSSIAIRHSKEKAIFLFFTINGKQAELMLDFCKKGDMIVASGSLEPDLKDDKKLILKINRFSKTFSNKKDEIEEPESNESPF